MILGIGEEIQVGLAGGPGDEVVAAVRQGDPEALELVVAGVAVEELRVEVNLDGRLDLETGRQGLAHARGVEPPDRGALDEFLEEGLGAGPFRAMAAVRHHQVQAVGQPAGDAHSELRRRYRIALAGEQQRRHVGAHQLVRVGGDGAARPVGADPLLLADAVVAQQRAGGLPRRGCVVDERQVLGAGDREVHPHGEDAVDLGAPGGGESDQLGQVAVVRPVHGERQLAGRRAVHHEAQAFGDQPAAGGHLHRAAGLRVGKPHLDAAVDALHDRLQLLAEARKSGVTGRVGGAFGKQQVDRPLAGVGVVQRDGLVDGSHPVEHHAAHRLRMAPQIDLRRAGAVGAAEQIDLLVAEPAPHLVHVVHAQSRGVEPQVGQLREPLPAPADRERREKIARQQRRIGALAMRVRTVEVAVEGIRSSGAALVDQQDVAAPAQLLLGQQGEAGGHPLPRSAAQVDDRVGRPIGAERRQDHDVEVDLAPPAGVAVLPHRVGAAEHLLLDAAGMTGLEAVRRPDRRCHRGRAERQQEGPRQHRDGSKGEGGVAHGDLQGAAPANCRYEK
ncbi:MAG TPA: hypothetical protein VHR45_05775 [Thermoanaerobaculia bacterium]|nr:hypothetical protein [Thermoanaerobaculia bacterium]